MCGSTSEQIADLQAKLAASTACIPILIEIPVTTRRRAGVIRKGYCFFRYQKQAPKTGGCSCHRYFRGTPRRTFARGRDAALRRYYSTNLPK